MLMQSGARVISVCIRLSASTDSASGEGEAYSASFFSVDSIWGTTMKGTVHYETRGNIALMTVDNPPVNPLSSGVRQGSLRWRGESAGR